jgi:hypothetical protein
VPIRPLLALLPPLLAFCLASCATYKPRVQINPTGDPLRDNEAQLAAAPEQDRTLWHYRLAASALHQGRMETAKTNLDAALAPNTHASDTNAPGTRAPGANAPDTSTRASASAKRKPDKSFASDPYERAMANYYRAILHWSDGELDSARTLLRNAQRQDIDAGNETGNYVLPDYLDGLITAKLTPGAPPDAGAAALSLSRARANAAAQNRPPPPDYDPSANVFVCVDYGDGPLKYTSADDGEIHAYTLATNPCQLATLRIGGQTVELAPYDDLGFQAITRGGRLTDQVSADKTPVGNFIESTGSALMKAGIGIANLPMSDNRNGISNTSVGIVTPPSTYSNGNANGDARSFIFAVAAKYGISTVLMVASAPFNLVSKALSKTPQSDTRCWDNLPRYLSFAALTLPPGAHEAELTFYDTHGRAFTTQTQQFTITVPDPAALPIGAAPKDVVVYRSQLRN